MSIYEGASKANNSPRTRAKAVMRIKLSLGFLCPFSGDSRTLSISFLNDPSKQKAPPEFTPAGFAGFPLSGSFGNCASDHFYSLLYLLHFLIGSLHILYGLIECFPGNLTVRGKLSHQFVDARNPIQYGTDD